MYQQYSNYFPTKEPEQLEYILIISTTNCPYSQKIMELLKQIPLSIQLQALDVQESIRNREPIPNYIDGVPQLIVANQNTNEIQTVLLGYQQVSEWLNKNKVKDKHSTNVNTSKGSTSGGSNFASIGDAHGRCRLPLPKIELDEYGRPTCGSEIFTVETEQRSRGGDTGELTTNDIQKQREELDRQMGLGSRGPMGAPPQTEQPRQQRTNSSKGGRKLQSAAGNNNINHPTNGGRKLQPVGSGTNTSGGRGNFSAVGSVNNSNGRGRGNYAPVGK
jgi:hypothetical protein